jgi:hypothetical protein
MPAKGAPGAPAAAEAEEYKVLRAARAALPADPGRALALTDEHGRRFGRGMLSQEREAIAVEALARLGRKTEANARLSRFVRQFPGSPYRARIEALVNRLRDPSAGP